MQQQRKQTSFKIVSIPFCGYLGGLKKFFFLVLMSPGFGLVQAPAYVWPAALSSAAMRSGTSSDVQGKTT